MPIIQDRYDITKEIAAMLESGEWQRYGSVIRRAAGPNGGQIVMLLKPVEQAKGCIAKGLQYAKDHPVVIGVGSCLLITTAVATVFAVRECIQVHDAEIVEDFKIELMEYFSEISEGDLKSATIRNLSVALDKLEAHRRHEKLELKIVTPEVEALVDRMSDYTRTLADNNNFELAEGELPHTGNTIIDLRKYLRIQQWIFEAAA